MRNKAKIAVTAAVLILFSVITASALYTLDIAVDKDPAIQDQTLTATITSDGSVEGIYVQFVLNDAIAGSGNTSANGRAVFKPEQTGTLKIIASKEGYVQATKEISVIESPTATTPPSGPSGGAGGGGGGVVSAEPYDNILKYITLTGNLIANTSVLYNFGARPEWTPDLCIYEMRVTGKESENDIAIRLELLKGTSKLVTASPPGAVYKNINIWAGSKRIKEALIRFRVNNSWIDSSGQAGSDVKMLRWDGTRWTQLVTTVLSKDPDITYFEARTEALSPFAVSGLKGVVVPTAGPAAPEETVTVPPPSAKPPDLTWLYVLIIILIIAVAAYYLYTAAQKKEKK